MVIDRFEVFEVTNFNPNHLPVEIEVEVEVQKLEATSVAFQPQLTQLEDKSGLEVVVLGLCSSLSVSRHDSELQT